MSFIGVDLDCAFSIFAVHTVRDHATLEDTAASQIIHLTISF